MTSAPKFNAPDDEFDYVVIGAGSSGCVIVNRLTADPSVRVLLLEAGGPNVDPLIQLPGKWTTLLGTALDWNYQIEAVPGLGGRSIRWPRGKAYGGSTTISAMAYVRGHQLDFAGWAETCGAGWDYASVLPHFRRIEDNSRGASDFHGAASENDPRSHFRQAVTDQTDPHAGHLAFLEAARDLGYAANPHWDFSGATQENGAGFYQKNIRAGRRHSAAAAFLTPVIARPNLTVWPNTHVLRLLFEGTRATGVACARPTAAADVRARRGVILSAGTIGTPKILMLSGIGPADALRAHGIAVRMDRPGVGANLHDHPRVPVRWAARAPFAPSSVSAGLLTWSQRGATPRPPDLQFYVGRGIDTPDPAITLTVALSRPVSRGRVSLRSADPMAAPLIQPNYLAEPADVDALVEGVRIARALAGTRAYTTLRGAATDPGDAVRTGHEVRAYIRRVADTMFHPVGTCRMGRDAEAIVDPQLRVRGVEGLWVADASVMPVSVNCQTHAATAMIGERLATEFL